MAFPTLPHYEFLHISFGVKGESDTFQRGMMLALSGIPWSKVTAYMDDIIIQSETFKQHVLSLKKSFKRITGKWIQTETQENKIVWRVCGILKVFFHLKKNLSGALISYCVKSLANLLIKKKKQISAHYSKLSQTH